MKKIQERMEFRPLLALLIIIALCGILSGGEFFIISVVDGHLYGRLIDILRNGSRYMVLAIGMTMVLATGGTDISVGSVMAISGALACSIVDERILPGLGGNVIAAVVIALTSGALCGAWNGFLVAKLKVQPIVATMILMTAGRGIAQLIADVSTKVIDAHIQGDHISFLNGILINSTQSSKIGLSLTKPVIAARAVETPSSVRVTGIALVQQETELFHTHGGHCQLVNMNLGKRLRFLQIAVVGTYGTTTKCLIQFLGNQVGIAVYGHSLVTVDIGIILVHGSNTIR